MLVIGNPLKKGPEGPTGLVPAGRFSIYPKGSNPIALARSVLDNANGREVPPEVCHARPVCGFLQHIADVPGFDALRLNGHAIS